MVPPGTAGLHEAALQSVLLAVGACISLGAQLAGPLILMAWMINVLVGVLGRLAPRMNVFLSIGMTLLAVGVVLVMLSCLDVGLTRGCASRSGRDVLASSPRGGVTSEASDQEKKHAPGERKPQGCRRKRQYPRSAELGGAAVVIATAAAFVFGSGLISRCLATPSASGLT